MLDFLIRRTFTSDEGTFGTAELVDDSNVLISLFRCLTLELPWRDNHPEKSCIPAGQYFSMYKYSPHFKSYLYHLLDVSKRSDILIHSGNHAGDADKGFLSDVTGCILLGTTKGYLAGQLSVLSSKLALADFLRCANQQSMQVTISWFPQSLEPEHDPAPTTAVVQPNESEDSK